MQVHDLFNTSNDILKTCQCQSQATMAWPKEPFKKCPALKTTHLPCKRITLSTGMGEVYVLCLIQSTKIDHAPRVWRRLGMILVLDS